ncbi:unnamed protein product [Parajaminaea phylloscopi]
MGRRERQPSSTPDSPGPASTAGDSPAQASPTVSALATASGPGSKSKRPKPYASKTCSECRRRKIACVVSDPDPNKCRRCFKKRLHCTLPEETERSDKRRRSSAIINYDRSDRQSDTFLSTDDAPAEAVPHKIQRHDLIKTASRAQSRTKSEDIPLAASHPSRPIQPVIPAFSNNGPNASSAGLVAPRSEETEQQPEIDFIFSTKEEKDRPRHAVGHARLGSGSAATGPSALGQPLRRRAASSQKQASMTMRKAAAQNVMLVHGSPMWVYSDLLTRFDLLKDQRPGVTGTSPHFGEGETASDLSAKLVALSSESVRAIDGLLEDCRLTLPHIPLLRWLLVQQDRRYNSGRLLLMAMLVYIATSGAEPSSATAIHVSKPLLAHVRAFVRGQTMQSVLFSPVQSRDLAIATELFAIYDPMLGHPSLGAIESPSFVLPTSFYLDAAAGAASRLNLEQSIHRLQRWYLSDTSVDDRALLPERIVESLLEASLWVSLEVHTAEVSRNAQGIPNCFGKNWSSKWPTGLGAPSFSTVVTYCLRRLAQDPTERLSVGTKLGLLNLALRQTGLCVIQEVLAALYDGIPDVVKIDRWYASMEDKLASQCKELAEVSRTYVASASSHRTPATGASSASAQKRLLDLSHVSLESESAWMRHFYGGYCFAILLWLPKLKRGPSHRKSLSVSTTGADSHAKRSGLSAKARAEQGQGDKSLADDMDEKGSATPAGGNSPRFHEHGVHDSDIAKSVIDALKDKNSNPDTMLADAGAHHSASGMSPFEFIVKHHPGHEAGLQRYLRLTLDTHARAHPLDIKRAVTNSRMIYACKEIIENHATRKRGWGKVGDEAAVHVKLLRSVSDSYKVKTNVLDAGLAKLVKVLEGILIGWRKAKAPAPAPAPTTSLPKKMGDEPLPGGRNGHGRVAVPLSDIRGSDAARLGQSGIESTYEPRADLLGSAQSWEAPRMGPSFNTGMGVSSASPNGGQARLAPVYVNDPTHAAGMPLQHHHAGGFRGSQPAPYHPHNQASMSPVGYPPQNRPFDRQVGSSGWSNGQTAHHGYPSPSGLLPHPADAMSYGGVQQQSVTGGSGGPPPTMQGGYPPPDALQHRVDNGTSLGSAVGGLSVPPPPPFSLAELDLFAPHYDEQSPSSTSAQHAGYMGGGGNIGTPTDPLFNVDLETLWQSFGAPSSLLMDGGDGGVGGGGGGSEGSFGGGMPDFGDLQQGQGSSGHTPDASLLTTLGTGGNRPSGTFPPGGGGGVAAAGSDSGELSQAMQSFESSSGGSGWPFADAGDELDFMSGLFRRTPP